MRSKLIAALQTFSPGSLRKFSRFMNSPYFNRRDKLSLFWETLYPFAPDFDQKELTKAYLFRKIMGPKKAYNERVFNNLSSDLLKLIYDFMLLERFREMPVQKEVALMEALVDRELYQHLNGAYRRVKELQGKNENQNHTFHQHWYGVYECLDREFLTHQSRGEDPNLQLLNDHLDRAYWINKLRIACGMLNRNRVVKAAYQCHFLKPLLDYLSIHTGLLDENPALAIYFQAYQLLNASSPTEAEIAYRNLKADLNAWQKVLPPNELYAVYNYALNYCIEQINSGNGAYYAEILDLYKGLLANGILLKKDHLNQWTYKNIITAGIRSEAFEWTENFIQTYKNHLPKEEQAHAYAYNMAMWYHAQGHFREALQQLQNIEFGHPFYHVGAKTIQLQIYFELEEGEAFHALYDAFQKYLFRNRKLNDHHKSANLNFIKLTRKVFDLRQEQKRLPKITFQSKWNQLFQQQAQSLPLAHKSWLEQQLLLIKPATMTS